MKYTIINILTGAVVLAPVHASAIRSYLASYGNHERLMIYAEGDDTEGMSPAEWLAENPS